MVTGKAGCVQVGAVQSSLRLLLGRANRGPDVIQPLLRVLGLEFTLDEPSACFIRRGVARHGELDSAFQSASPC